MPIDHDLGQYLKGQGHTRHLTHAHVSAITYFGGGYSHPLDCLVLIDVGCQNLKTWGSLLDGIDIIIELVEALVYSPCVGGRRLGYSPCVGGRSLV